jgi:hypothetical protein
LACPICKLQRVQKWGTQNDKQRYRCANCYHNFTLRNGEVKKANQFVWFYKWVMERQVYQHLIRDSGMSQSSLQRLFKFYLNAPPANTVKSKGHVHLLIDGTYFENGLCLILYYDYDIQYVQLFRQTNQEKFREIKEDLQNLKKLGTQIYSVTCDGHKSIIKAVAKAFPNTIVQRCIVHVKRQIKNYLGVNPQLIQARELLYYSKQITQISSQEQATAWLIEVHDWYRQHQGFINQKSFNASTGRSWYTHKHLHQATTHLINAIPNLFSYLSDEQIPKSTNQIEGYFAHLKEKLTLHRGLRLEAKKNFIKWYLHFKNQEKRSRFS